MVNDKQLLNTAYGRIVNPIPPAYGVTDGELSREINRAVRLHNEMKKAATNGDPLAAILTTPIEPRKEN